MSPETLRDREPTTRYLARYMLLADGFVQGAAMDVAQGRIVAIHADRPATSPQEHGMRVVDLGEVALVPGLVNAHSHAFQRAMRGASEHIEAAHQEDNFWTWRTAMYRTALRFGADAMEAVARLTFLEMALSGMTTVGEFHYVHHQPDGVPYEDPNELAHRMIAAAREVGLRIVLLRVAYHRAGFGLEANPLQRRFVEPDPETTLVRFEALRARHVGQSAVHFGLAPHSIRAVPAPWLAQYAQHAHAHNLPLHIHACEQRGELLQSQAEYGMSPIAVLDGAGMLDPRLTIVHGTHLDAPDLELLEKSRPTICACPTTERNLGDGFLPARALLERGLPIALGTDSQTVIDLWEDMRLVEYHERLGKEARNILASFGGPEQDRRGAKRWATGPVLWPMATRHGAMSLGVDAGVLVPGALADFAGVDLGHISLVGSDADSLLNNMALSMSAAAVRDVFVAGEQIVQGGRHVRQEAIVRSYQEALARSPERA